MLATIGWEYVREHTRLGAWIEMTGRDSVDALDDELARRTDEEGRIGAALVELDGHRGRALLSAGALGGETARRWALCEPAWEALWQDFDRFRTVLAEAREVRSARARPGQRELDELRRLLRGRSVEVARVAVALPDRLRTPAAQRVEQISLNELSERIDVEFYQVSTLVLDVDRIYQAFLDEFGPLAERLRAARALVGDLGLPARDPTALHAAKLTERSDQLQQAATADPLSLDQITSRPVHADLGTQVTKLEARLAGLVRARDGWPDALAEVTGRLREVESLGRRADNARARAVELIENADIASPADRLSPLRAELAGLPEVTGWTARADRLERLRAALDAAADELRASHDRAAGLVERRAELRGRYEAYRAKAVRLDRAEHPRLLELDQRLRQLLWTRPCDLAEATRALADYQRLVSAPGSRG